MTKTWRIILSGIIALVIVIYGMTLLEFVVYKHKFERNYNQFIWVLNDAHRSKVDSIIFGGKSRKRDVYYDYIYNQYFYLSIWEFKDLAGIELSSTLIKKHIKLSNVTFKSGEIFNENLSPKPQITLKLGFEFKVPSVTINLDELSEIRTVIDSRNYKGFYGTINRMSFTNTNNEHLILFDYKRPEPTLFVIYKARNSFFVIMINSEKPFDENIINILNLN